MRSAVDAGAVFFDHADVYGDDLCEEIFAGAIGMSPAVRGEIILQSKCGVVRGKMFDFSKEHVLAAGNTLP